MERGEELLLEEEEDRGSLSFRIDSPVRISAVDSSIVVDGDGDDDDGDFDFSFVPVPETGPPIAATDIFSDGKIRPTYPLFNRDLLLIDCNNNNNKEESKESGGLESRPRIRLPLRRLFMEEEEEQSSFSSTSSSSSSSTLMDELDGIPAGTYCVWTPPSNKDRCKKSRSTGSTASLRWRLRDLIVGQTRSQSHGKEKFAFLHPDPREGKTRK